ncbi:hypothetical protein ACS0TY_028414 [Phlomoides rotata]
MTQFPLAAILCTLLLSIKESFGVDILLPNQPISIGQTLISHGQDFEMGFFSPGNSPNRFLGIWSKINPHAVIWVANRKKPISESHGDGVTFSISENGSLVISSTNGILLWSANPSVAASNPILQLLDTGNLVLVNETMEQGSYIMWQSFDYPGDTFLPGMKFVDDPDAGVVKYATSWRNWDDPSPGDFVARIENKGLPDFVVYRGKMKTFRCGKWNGRYFNGVPSFPNPIFKPELVFRGERLISITPDTRNRPTLRRTTLQASGVIHVHIISARKDKWNHVLTLPADRCDEYGLCGPNSICSFNNPTKSQCQCLKGFAPKFQKDWDFGDCYGGCTRIAPLNCKSGDGFQEVRGVKHPDMLEFWLNTTSMSLDECKAECLKSCNCTAYANAYITNGGSGCILWFGDLIDTKLLPGADTKQNIYVRLPVSELVDNSNPDIGKEKKRPTRLILISIATGVIVSGFINGGIFMMRRPRKQVTKENNEDLELPLLTFATIVAATNNFSRDNMIGKGGFGPVYKGILPSGEEIAIKRLSTTSGQGLEEFRNEAIYIAKLQHTNLVRLLGCCIEGDEMILIYEYLHNKSLDYFIFDPNRRKLLTWPNRFNIVMGIGRGLLYLHQDSRLKIIHRDLKPSNILLDGNLNPKISDFGLAKTFGEDQPGARTNRVVGTYGYMAPEYIISGKFSVKLDIFSIGVILLEIVSGKKNRGFECSCDHFHSLVGHAWLLWKENKSVELMDECLKDTFVESELKRCIHVGLLCVQQIAEDRPVMSSVLFMLGNDEAILPEPKEPDVVTGRGSTPERSVISPNPVSEKNSITISDLEAR